MFLLQKPKETVPTLAPKTLSVAAAFNEDEDVSEYLLYFTLFVKREHACNGMQVEVGTTFGSQFFSFYLGPGNVSVVRQVCLAAVLHLKPSSWP